jgi:hypothetical protein
MPAVCKKCGDRGILKRPKTVRYLQTLFIRLKVILYVSNINFKIFVESLAFNDKYKVFIHQYRSANGCLNITIIR